MSQHVASVSSCQNHFRWLTSKAFECFASFVPDVSSSLIWIVLLTNLCLLRKYSVLFSFTQLCCKQLPTHSKVCAVSFWCLIDGIDRTPNTEINCFTYQQCEMWNRCSQKRLFKVRIAWPLSMYPPKMSKPLQTPHLPRSPLWSHVSNWTMLLLKL